MGLFERDSILLLGTFFINISIMKYEKMQMYKKSCICLSRFQQKWNQNFSTKKLFINRFSFYEKWNKKNYRKLKNEVNNVCNPDYIFPLQPKIFLIIKAAHNFFLGVEPMGPGQFVGSMRTEKSKKTKKNSKKDSNNSILLF